MVAPGHAVRVAEQPARLAAIAQQVLQGVPLPANRELVVTYAKRQNASPELLAALRGLPKTQFRRLDDVGEALAPVQPAYRPPSVRTPHGESDRVPGGEGYTDPLQEPGWIRDQPEILQYEHRLVREPGGATPQVGERDTKPTA